MVFLLEILCRFQNFARVRCINENGVVAPALLVAESDPKQKELMIHLILNVLSEWQKIKPGTEPGLCAITATYREFK